MTLLRCAASLSMATSGELMRKDMVCLVSLMAGGKLHYRTVIRKDLSTGN